MIQTAKLDVRAGDSLSSLRELFKALLGVEGVEAILVPQTLPGSSMVMPVLVKDPAALENADPLAPAFPLNGAGILSKLTRKPLGGKVAAVLRPCEIRAFVELVKLRQGALDEVVLVGIDCLGAFQNRDYFRFVKDVAAGTTALFCRTVLSSGRMPLPGVQIADACKACEFPVPTGADILVGLYGVDTDDHLLVQSRSARGMVVMDALGLPEIEEPPLRAEAVARVVAQRTAFRDRMFEETAGSIHGMEKLAAYLSRCVNCYNCKVACPVCYCRECVFATDVFDHEPFQYLRWAARKGRIKMPTDTLFYHITRLAHMSTACVGCGQCSNACPNEVPVMELFRTVSHRAQKAFGYEPGRDVEEKPPLTEFQADEFHEVEGMTGVGK